MLLLGMQKRIKRASAGADLKELITTGMHTAAELMNAEPPIVPWLIQPWLIEGQYHLITAYQGFQKSYFSLFLASKVAATGKKVFFIDLENDKGTIIRRFHHLNVPSVENFHYWGDWRGLESHERPPAALDDIYLEIAATYEPLIIFDSLNRFHQAEENSNTDMKVIMEFAKELTKRGATVWIIHQAGKPKEDGSYDSRGASEIGAGVDIHWQISGFKNLGDEKNPQNLLTLQCKKAREFPAFATKVIFDSHIGQFCRVPGKWAEQEMRAKEMFKLLRLRDSLLTYPAQSLADRDWET